MAFSQDDIDKLKQAIASGIRRVTYDTHTVEYQDTDAMIKALSMMEGEVAGTTRPRRTVAAYRSDL